DCDGTFEQECQHLGRLANKLNTQTVLSQFSSIGIELERPEANYVLASGCSLHGLSALKGGCAEQHTTRLIEIALISIELNIINAKGLPHHLNNRSQSPSFH